MIKVLKRSFSIFLVIITSFFLLIRSAVPPTDQVERIRSNTRTIEFDYVEWLLDALKVKQIQTSLGIPAYLPEDQQKNLVNQCLNLIDQVRQTNNQIEGLYAESAGKPEDKKLRQLESRVSGLSLDQERLGPVCEEIIQAQLNSTLRQMGFTLGGQAVPPPLFRVTPLPYALIVSPRSTIRQDANISLRTDLSLPEMIILEKNVEDDQGISALVVPVGGIGIYPTMVISTSSINTLVEIVSHEWIHNYLTLRPLGLSYDNSPEARTMNETTASIAEKEIAALLLSTFYPESLPQLRQPVGEFPETENQESNPPVFNFNTEMRETRITVDKLLSEGKISEAENFMEDRRQVFLQNGYQIRRLNQAYFAFHGAYAAEPGGPAGQDPVGPAVRALRDQSDSLVDFVNRISWMTNLEELNAAIR